MTDNCLPFSWEILPADGNFNIPNETISCLQQCLCSNLPLHPFALATMQFVNTSTETTDLACPLKRPLDIETNCISCCGSQLGFRASVVIVPFPREPCWLFMSESSHEIFGRQQSPNSMRWATLLVSVTVAEFADCSVRCSVGMMPVSWKHLEGLEKEVWKTRKKCLLTSRQMVSMSCSDFLCRHGNLLVTGNRFWSQHFFGNFSLTGPFALDEPLYLRLYLPTESWCSQHEVIASSAEYWTVFPQYPLRSWKITFWSFQKR